MLTPASGYIALARKYAKTALLPSVLIYIIGAFGSVSIGSTTIFLTEQAICREYYMSMQLGVHNNPGGLIDEELCKIPEVQTQVASINGVYKVLAFLPALFLTGPYGRISEVLGKRSVLFLNLLSLTLRELFFTGVCYFQLPIQLIFFTPCFDIVGGGTVIMSSFIYSYIAEAVEPQDLSTVFYKLTTAQLLISFLGMSLSSWLLRNHVWVLCLVGISAIACCIPSTLLFPSNFNICSTHSDFIPGRDDIDQQNRAAEAGSGSNVESSLNSEDETRIYGQEPSETTSLLSHSRSSSTTKVGSVVDDPTALPKSSIPLDQSAFSTILQALTTQYVHSLSLFRDIYNSSQLSRTTLLSYFLIGTSLSITVIFVQWASVTFHWIIADVNAVTSFEVIVSGAVLLSLPVLSRKFLHPKLGYDLTRVDIFITTVSVALHAVGLLGLGFAPNKIAYIAAATIWACGIGWDDSLRSFVTGLVADKDEIHKLYLGIGMMETCSGMLGTAVWSAAFARLVGEGYIIKRSLFLAGCSLLVVSLIPLYRLGRYAKGRRNLSGGA